MKTSTTVVTTTLAALAAIALPARAQDVAAGKAKAESVCAACHGANGISVTDAIPNLAGQKPAYLGNQLRALKDGVRKNAVMNAIAGQLSADDITNVAAFYGSLAGPTTAAAKSDMLPALVKSGVSFPENYRATYTLYTTVNRPDINQVRYLYANPVALQAAKDGKPLPDGSVLVLEQFAAKLGPDRKPVAGANGFFEPDRFVAFAVMERGPGWGQDIPEILRNADWNYAVFGADKKPRAGVNQAECLACHKPLDKASYTFSWNQLTAKATAR
jgi:cytochrome c553